MEQATQPVQIATHPQKMVTPHSSRGPAGLVAAVAVLAAALWGILQIPMDVPDTSSPPAGNQTGTANDWTSTGQTFVPRRDGLNRISLVLGAEKATDQVDVTFQIKDSPKGSPLRTVKRPISSLPEGNPGDFRPGTRAERWYTFDFEPIPDSGGRNLYFAVEGKDVPKENTVSVLMFYHNQYPSGTAYKNEKSEEAHVVFRTYSQGKVADYVGVLAENLTRNRPGPLGSLLTYLGLALLYLGLTAALLKAMWKMGKTAS